MKPEKLIGELKKFDNEEGYQWEYKKIKKELSGVIKELIKINDPEILHPLLIHEETWSCLFALEILQELKDKKSIPYLIEFLKKNDDSDYFESCEPAMFALQNIGKAAVEPLLKEIKELFRQKRFLIYLVGALTEIKDNRIYDFMYSVTEDYIKNVEKYKDWFMIDAFVYDFEAQGKKEILPLLKELREMEHLTRHEIIEIDSAIEVIEDPEKYYDDLKKVAEEMKSENFDFEERKLGRNELCHCGSGIKYKKCCLERDVEETGKVRRVPSVAG